MEGRVNQITFDRIKKSPYNTKEIKKLIDFAYMNVEGDGFSTEDDVLNYKRQWAERIGIIY